MLGRWSAAPYDPQTMSGERFRLSTYMIRRKVFKIFGGAFHIYGPDGSLVFYSKKAAFKLKEDIRLYTGEDMQHEVLTIKARNIIDFSAIYDVVDAETGQPVGALQRRGMQSLVQDEWAIMDASGQQIGLVQEESTVLALIRRFVVALIPQTFLVEHFGRRIGQFRQHFNPFVMKITADFGGDPGFAFDRRLGLAALLLIAAIEGRQG
jgi:uncharacterized protein YxjI